MNKNQVRLLKFCQQYEGPHQLTSNDPRDYDDVCKLHERGLLNVWRDTGKLYFELER